MHSGDPVTQEGETEQPLEEELDDELEEELEEGQLQTHGGQGATKHCGHISVQGALQPPLLDELLELEEELLDDELDDDRQLGLITTPTVAQSVALVSLWEMLSVPAVVSVLSCT